LAPWEGSVTRRDGVTTSTGEEVALMTGKGGDNIGWTDTNLLGQKMRKINTVDLVAIIGR
jgi:hypothetical protein